MGKKHFVKSNFQSLSPIIFQDSLLTQHGLNFGFRAQVVWSSSVRRNPWASLLALLRRSSERFFAADHVGMNAAYLDGSWLVGGLVAIFFSHILGITIPID